MKGFLFTIGMSLILGILKLTLLPLLSWWLVGLPVLIFFGLLLFGFTIFFITYIVMGSIDIIEKKLDN